MIFPKKVHPKNEDNLTHKFMYDDCLQKLCDWMVIHPRSTIHDDNRQQWVVRWILLCPAATQWYTLALLLTNYTQNPVFQAEVFLFSSSFLFQCKIARCFSFIFYFQTMVKPRTVQNSATLLIFYAKGSNIGMQINK